MNANRQSKTRVALFLLLLVGLLAVVAAPYVRADDGSIAAQSAKTVKRPLSDWLNAQGTYCWDDEEGGCLLFVPPVPNYLAWTDPPLNRIASFDYAGIANQWIIDNGGTSLGTSFAGSIIENALPDGRARVKVTLNTKKALAWATVLDEDVVFGAPLFGNTAQDVLAGAKPGLCNGQVRLTFINTAPGAPLPDLIQLLFFPEAGQETLALSVKCNAKGPLHAAAGVAEGTIGRMIVTQKAKLISGELTYTRETVIFKVGNK